MMGLDENTGIVCMNSSEKYAILIQLQEGFFPSKIILKCRFILQDGSQFGDFSLGFFMEGKPYPIA